MMHTSLQDALKDMHVPMDKLVPLTWTPVPIGGQDEMKSNEALFKYADRLVDNNKAFVDGSFSYGYYDFMFKLINKVREQRQTQDEATHDQVLATQNKLDLVVSF